MSTQRQRRQTQGVGEVVVLSEDDDVPPVPVVPARARPSTSRRTSLGRSTRHRSPSRRRPRNPPASHGGTQAPPDVIDLTGPGDYDDVAITSVRHGGDRPQKRQKVSTPTVGSLTRSAASPESHREPQCAICMEAMRQLASGPCGHVFCEGCLRAAVKAQKRCPSCRKPMQPKQIHRIFLNLQSCYECVHSIDALSRNEAGQQSSADCSRRWLLHTQQDKDLRLSVPEIAAKLAAAVLHVHM